MMTIDSATVDKDEIERFSRIADEWWDEKGKFRPLHQMNPLRIGYIRDHICEHLGRKAEQKKSLSGLSILDIGCGGGLLCEPFTRLGAEVTGIDAAEKNIKVASLHAEKMGLDIHYQNTSAEILAENGKQFDVVFALEIIEHVADIPAFIKAITSLVKPGGLLFLSTINRTVKSYVLAIVGAEYVMRWLPRGTHQWKKFVRPSELCERLRTENMQIHHMTGMIFNPLKNSWHLDEGDLATNYILCTLKSA